MSAMADQDNTAPRPSRAFIGRSSSITNREQYDKLWNESRLSLPPFVRLPLATLTAFGIGMALGLTHGSKMAGLRFRAEHAHRLPTSTTGWYMYHKSKNYHLAFGGLKEGFKVGGKLAVLSTAMFCVENLFDVYRGTKDMFNTVMASLAIANGFSLWSAFSLFLRRPKVHTIRSSGGLLTSLLANIYALQIDSRLPRPRVPSRRVSSLVSCTAACKTRFRC